MQSFLTENGRKNTAAKQLSSWLHPAVTTYFESHLKNGALNQEAHAPIFIHAHIQLAGDDLTNNHTFKLLSGLLKQTLPTKNIAPQADSVNPNAFSKKGLPSGKPFSLYHMMHHPCIYTTNRHRTCNHKHLCAYT